MKILLKVCGEGTKRWSSSSGTLYKIFQELRKRSHVALYGSVTKNVGIVVLNLLQLSFGVLVFVLSLELTLPGLCVGKAKNKSYIFDSVSCCRCGTIGTSRGVRLVCPSVERGTSLRERFALSRIGSGSSRRRLGVIEGIRATRDTRAGIRLMGRGSGRHLHWSSNGIEGAPQEEEALLMGDWIAERIQAGKVTLRRPNGEGPFLPGTRNSV